MAREKEPKTLSEAFEQGRRVTAKRMIGGIVAASLLMGVAGGLTGYFLGKSHYENTITLANGQVYRLDEYDLKILQAYELIKNEWLFGQDIDSLEQVITDNMINGQLDNDDDPYTFYTPDMDSQGLSTDGKGLGIVTRSYFGAGYVEEVLDGPARNAGLKPGDVIESITVDGVEHQGYEAYLAALADLAAEETATPGLSRTLYLAVRHADGVAATLGPLQRGTYSDPIAYPSYERFGNQGLVQDENGLKKVTLRVDTFLKDSQGNGPTAKVAALLSQALALAGGKIDQLVIDLRGNGGGYVDEGVNLARLFVPKGTTIEEEVNKNGTVVSRYVQDATPEFGPAKVNDIRILFDGGSASATEMFALAMLGSHRATAYGLNSFGKGIAQTFFTFADGSVIRYTYAQVFGPNPEPSVYGAGDLISIHGRGITPDFKYGAEVPFLDTTLYDYAYRLQSTYLSPESFTGGGTTEKAAEDIFTAVLPFLYNNDHDPATADVRYTAVPTDYVAALAYYQAANGISENGFGVLTASEFNGELHDFGSALARDLLGYAESGQQALWSL